MLQILSLFLSLFMLDPTINEVRISFADYTIAEAGYSNATVIAYMQDIDGFFKILDIDGNNPVSILRDIDIHSIRQWLSHRRNIGIVARSNARALSAIRSFFKYLQSNYDVRNDAIFEISRPRLAKLLPNAIRYDEVLSLCDKVAELSKVEWQRLRDRSIVLLLFGSGMRISEALSIKVGEIHNAEDFIIVTGKGGKQRMVPILDQIKSSIMSYINSCPANIHDDDYLFLSNKMKKYSARAFQGKIKKATINLGFLTLVTPHTLRHSCATALLENGCNIVKIKKLLGHEKLSTTQIYTKVTTSTIENALDKANYWEE